MSRHVTIAEAAAYHKRTDRTIRRWIADGKVTVRDTPAGILVEIPDEVSGFGGHVRSMTDMTDKRTDMDTLCQRLADVTAERDYLRQMLAAAIARPLQLPAPLKPVQSRSWWRRMLGRE